MFLWLNSAKNNLHVILHDVTHKHIPVLIRRLRWTLPCGHTTTPTSELVLSTRKYVQMEHPYMLLLEWEEGSSQLTLYRKKHNTSSIVLTSQFQNMVIQLHGDSIMLSSSPYWTRLYLMTDRCSIALLCRRLLKMFLWSIERVAIYSTSVLFWSQLSSRLINYDDWSTI